jgi:hypothetical protein
MGGGFFLKLRFMRLEVLARPGNVFGPLFDAFSSMAETAFGLTAARAAWVNRCFVDIPPVGTFFTGWKVVSLTDIEGWLDRGIFIAGNLGVLAVGCGRAPVGVGDGNLDCNIGDPALECGWACFCPLDGRQPFRKYGLQMRPRWFLNLPEQIPRSDVPAVPTSRQLSALNDMAMFPYIRHIFIGVNYPSFLVGWESYFESLLKRYLLI